MACGGRRSTVQQDISEIQRWFSAALVAKTCTSRRGTVDNDIRSTKVDSLIREPGVQIVGAANDGRPMHLSRTRTNTLMDNLDPLRHSENSRLSQPWSKAHDFVHFSANSVRRWT